MRHKISELIATLIMAISISACFFYLENNGWLAMMFLYIALITGVIVEVPKLKKELAEAEEET